MNRIFDNWPRLVLIYLPLMLAAVPGTVLVRERLQPDTDKAIRIVRESNSRKENFTVQQYLYSTVFHRQRLGEKIEIEGWSAVAPPDQGTSIVVEFGYSDSLGHHIASWAARLKDARATPLNDAARDLSWH